MKSTKEGLIYIGIFILGIIFGVASNYVAMNKVIELEREIHEKEFKEKYNITDKNSCDDAQKEPTTGFDTSSFNTIMPSQIKELSNGKTIVVWIGAQGCGYCQMYAPLIEKVSKDYKIVSNYIDTQTLTPEEDNILMSLDGDNEWKGFIKNFTGTPFTIIVKDNKIIGGLDGYWEEEKIQDAFYVAGLRK